MIDWETISKKDLEIISFKSVDPHKSGSISNELLYENEKWGKARISGFELDNIRNEHEYRLNLLITKIQAICHERLDNKTDNLALAISGRVGVSESLVRKIFNKSKPITAEFVAFICIGFQLSEDISKELFDLLGYHLFPDINLFDRITYVAIRDKDEIETYKSDLMRAGVKLRIFSWGNL